MSRELSSPGGRFDHVRDRVDHPHGRRRHRRVPRAMALGGPRVIAQWISGSPSMSTRYVASKSDANQSGATSRAILMMCSMMIASRPLTTPAARVHTAPQCRP